MLLDNNQQLQLKGDAGQWVRYLPGQAVQAYTSKADTFEHCQLAHGHLFAKRLVAGPLPLYVADEMVLDKILREQAEPNPLSVLSTNTERATNAREFDGYDTPIPLLIWPESGRYAIINPSPAAGALAGLKAALAGWPGPWPPLPAGKLRLPLAYVVDVLQRYNHARTAQLRQQEEEYQKKQGF